MEAAADFLDSLKFASPVAAFSYWHFEVEALAQERGLPPTLMFEVKPMFDAGRSPADAVARLAKKWGR
jgi:hypothetical protein